MLIRKQGIYARMIWMRNHFLFFQSVLTHSFPISSSRDQYSACCLNRFYKALKRFGSTLPTCLNIHLMPHLVSSVPAGYVVNNRRHIINKLAQCPYLTLSYCLYIHMCRAHSVELIICVSVCSIQRKLRKVLFNLCMYLHISSSPS